MLNVTGDRDVYIWVLAVSAPVLVRLRSANRGNSNNTWNVNSGGYLGNNNANNANNRALPACVYIFYAVWFARNANLRECSTQGANTLPKGEQLKADVVWSRPSTAVDSLISMNMENIIGFEALWESMMKCKRGVMWKDSVASFCLNAMREVSKLCDQLHDGTYTERPRKYFSIESPKHKDIMSISFRDRVYQRSLNDVGIYPVMSRGFIYDNCACQKNKGADFARERFKAHLQKYFRANGADGYVLKMDVRGYYPNMRHDVTKEIFRRKLDTQVFERAAEILDGFPGEKGFNPGSQIIQIAGISVLDPLDHFIKERMRVKHYIRYMDDMLIVGKDKTELLKVQAMVQEKLREIGFELHPTKTTVTPLSKGVMFLGFNYCLTSTGKVLMFVNPSRVKAARRKYRKLAEKVRNGMLTEKKYLESYMCWRSHAAKGNNHNLIRRMDTYIKELLEEENDGN